MAGIDKTYISSFKVFDQIRKWSKTARMTFPNGKQSRYTVFDWLYYPDCTEEEFNMNTSKGNDIVLWNTSTLEDKFLRKNCPFELVQQRLKEQYGEEGYNHDLLEEVKIPVIARKGRKIRYKIIHQPSMNIRVPDDVYMISIGKESQLRESNMNRGYFIGSDFEHIWEFSPLRHKWYNSDEYVCETDNEEYFPGGEEYPEIMNISKRKISRIIRKWNLPAGLCVVFHSMYQYKDGFNRDWVIKTI